MTLNTTNFSTYVDIQRVDIKRESHPQMFVFAPTDGYLR